VFIPVSLGIRLVMASSLLNILAALVGLGLLVFLHELGHFYVARLCGIRVEAFSIGFGRAIWSRRINGVEWRLGIFPFGGYVRLAGMELSEEALREPTTGSYFASPPWARIAAILAGPGANFIVCFLCFLLVFLLGGRPKSWQEINPYVGSIPKESPLAERRLSPGDRVVELDERPYTSIRDLMMASLATGPLTLTAQTPSWTDSSVRPVSIQVKRSAGTPKSLLWKPAQFLSIQQLNGASPFVEGSPLLDAGVEVGDRLVWMDGCILWNAEQVARVLNDQRALVTVERGGRRLLTRVLRQRASLTRQLDPIWRDWLYSAPSSSRRTGDFFVLPASIDSSLEVLSILPADDLSGNSGQMSDSEPVFLAREGLRVGDRILAIDGFSVQNGPSLVSQLQRRQARVIVQRHTQPPQLVESQEADVLFREGFQPEALTNLTEGLMSGQQLLRYGEFLMLSPVAVKPLTSFTMSPARADSLQTDITLRKRAILDIENPEKRRAALVRFEQEQRQNVLGILPSALVDQMVRYNPLPWVLFADAVDQSWLTLKGLVTGKVGAEHVNSPVGVFVAMKSSWENSAAEGIYLLGFVSLSLAIFNLLPVPILDGGYVVLAVVEWITGRRPSAQTMKWLFVPFFAALIGLMAFTVWNDLVGIFGGR
jgi:regulator of sigma E protease